MVEPEKNQKKVYLNWEDIELLIQKTAKEVKNIKNIYGIPRGGLIPAVRLSHILKIPLTQEIEENTLVVDEICDSGETLKKILEKHKVKTLSLHTRKSSKIKPDITGEFIQNNDWIVYPWEK